MIWTPTYVASRMIVSLLSRKVTHKLVFSLLTSTFHLIKNFGIFTTLSLLKKLFTILIHNTKDAASFLLIHTLQNSLNPLAYKILKEFLEDNIIELDHIDKDILKKLRKFIFFNLYFYLLKPIFINSLKFFGILSLSSVTVLWNGTLSSITWLKSFSENFIGFVTDFLPTIPSKTRESVKTIKESLKVSIKDFEDETENINLPNSKEDKNNLLIYLSLILLGFLLAGLGLIFLDYSYSDLPRSVPKVSEGLDGFYGMISNTWNYIKNIPSNLRDYFKRIDKGKGKDETIPSPTSDKSSKSIQLDGYDTNPSGSGIWNESQSGSGSGSGTVTPSESGTITPTPNSPVRSTTPELDPFDEELKGNWEDKFKNPFKNSNPFTFDGEGKIKYNYNEPTDPTDPTDPKDPFSDN